MRFKFVQVALVLSFISILVSPSVIVQQYGSSAPASSRTELLPPPSASLGSSFAPGYCISLTKCSEGLTDYGVLKSGGKYSYTAVEVESSTTFTKLNLGSGSGGGTAIGLQLNAVAWNVLEHKSYGEYWIQDVADITQSGSKFKISFSDNIWNYTTNPLSRMNGLVFGCGGSSSNQKYYGCGGPSFTTTLPFMIFLQERESLGSKSSQSSCISFVYQLFHGSTEISASVWDKVCFSSSFKAAKAPYYRVGGFNGYTYNALQNVLGGSCCSYVGSVKSISASMTLEYSSGGLFTTVPHAWSEGDTGETITGVKMTASGMTGKASSGTDNQVQLW
jgi:hypothetical protein